MDDLLPTTELLDRPTLEAKVRASEGAAREWLLALLQLHDRKLYRETHPSWDAYVLETFGYSHSTATRWLAQGREILALDAGPADKAAGQDRPRAAGLPSQRSAAKAQRTRRAPIPAASTEAPKTPERPAGPATPAPVRSGPTSAGGGPSSGAVSPPAGPNPTVAAPTIRAQLAHLFDHLADLDPAEAWEAMTTGQRELFRQWADIMRQATTVPPRVRTTPVALSRPVPLDRQEVTPMFKKAR